MWKTRKTLAVQEFLCVGFCLFFGISYGKDAGEFVENIFCRADGMQKMLRQIYFWYDVHVAVENFWGVFHRIIKFHCDFYPASNALSQLSLTALISSSSSMEKEVEAMRFLSTVLTDAIMVVWSRPNILPMPVKDISVMW